MIHLEFYFIRSFFFREIEEFLHTHPDIQEAQVIIQYTVPLKMLRGIL